MSTAAGAVGSAVGQIAKIKGCRAVGVAGGADKVRQCLEEFNYDAAIDYKNSSNLDLRWHRPVPTALTSSLTIRPDQSTMRCCVRSISCADRDMRHCFLCQLGSVE